MTAMPIPDLWPAAPEMLLAAGAMALLMVGAFRGDRSAPLVILTIAFGLFPRPVLDMSAASVTALVQNYHQSVGARKALGMLRATAD